MENEAQFSSKDKSKKLKCHLQQFSFGALRVYFLEKVKLIEFANSVDPQMGLHCFPSNSDFLKLEDVNFVVCLFRGL